MKEIKQVITTVISDYCKQVETKRYRVFVQRILLQVLQTK